MPPQYVSVVVIDPAVTTPVFDASGSPACLDVASGIEVAGRVVSRVVQVLEVQLVSTEGIGGRRIFGNGSVGVAVVVVRSLSVGLD